MELVEVGPDHYVDICSAGKINYEKNLIEVKNLKSILKYQ